jgi:hypothetical protein
MLVPNPSRVVGSALSTAERLFTGIAERAIDAAMRGPLVEAAARDLVRYHVIERATAELAEGDQLEEFMTRALDTPAARRMVAHVIDSAVVDEAVARLLESDELWILVDEVARSPSVTEAISHQSVGLADQVAGVVRERSRVADARLERVARRLIGRDGG